MLPVTVKANKTIIKEKVFQPVDIAHLQYMVKLEAESLAWTIFKKTTSMYWWDEDGRWMLRAVVEALGADDTTNYAHTKEAAKTEVTVMCGH